MASGRGLTPVTSRVPRSPHARPRRMKRGPTTSTSAPMISNRHREFPCRHGGTAAMGGERMQADLECGAGTRAARRRDHARPGSAPWICGSTPARPDAGHRRRRSRRGRPARHPRPASAPTTRSSVKSTAAAAFQRPAVGDRPHRRHQELRPRSAGVGQPDRTAARTACRWSASSAPGAEPPMVGRRRPGARRRRHSAARRLSVSAVAES